MLEGLDANFPPASYRDLPVDRTSRVAETSGSRNSELSWINRCYKKVTTAISVADTALREAGSAIKIAYDLFNSLLALEGDGTDNSVEGRYISELTLNMTSLDLKAQWSKVSAVWSNFMINIEKIIPEMHLKVHDGFLGNYPIQTT